MNGSAPAKVLVIEDDEILREVLTEVLRARGLEVVASARGDKAVELARQERFDLIVADIRMEGMNGLDAIEKAREFQPDVGSIVVSGFASEEETLRAVRLNVAGYLKKPFEVPELMELINSYLAQRAERNQRLQEQRGLRSALLWSLEQQAAWAEKATSGSVLRPARLAERISHELGLPAEMSRMTYLGTAMRRVEQLGGTSPDEDALSAFASYPSLLKAWREEELDTPATLAVVACQDLAHDEDLPSPEMLEVTDERLLQAYKSAVIEADEGTAREPEVAAEQTSATSSGLLALARTLEHGGDLEGAMNAFHKVAAESGVSQLGLAGLFGVARVAMAQGATTVLEKTMSELLALAEKLGPVAFGIAELEGAKILHTAGHPATKKLLHRATQSLARVSLTIPWATAVVSLARLDEEKTHPALAKALELLSLPQHQQEMLEHLDALIPSLLCFAPGHPASELAFRLLIEYPHEVASPLRAGRLSTEARSHLLALLETRKTSVPEALLEPFRNDPDPDLRERGLKLQSGLSRTESLPVLKVHALGQLEVSIGDQPIDDRLWKTQKTKHLFAKLADLWPRMVSVERVMAELWPDSDQTAARNNLNAAVSAIRKILRTGSKEFDPVLRVGETLGLNPDQPFWYDVKELELAGQQGERCFEVGKIEKAMSYFSRAVRLYRGPYLEGNYYDWVSQRQLTLENRVVEALHRLVEHRAKQHRHREALEYALILIVLSPEHEQAHEVAMSSYLGLEQHDKAVAHFETHQECLEKELNEEAMIGLTRLYHMARYGIVSEPASTLGL